MTAKCLRLKYDISAEAATAVWWSKQSDGCSQALHFSVEMEVRLKVCSVMSVSAAIY